MTMNNPRDLPVLETLAVSASAAASFTGVFFIGLLLPPMSRGLERLSEVLQAFLAGLWAMPLVCLTALLLNLHRRLPGRAIVDTALLIFNILLSLLVTASIVE